MSRRYRNRRLGEFLKELDFTEGRSTGIPKILRAMKANGSPMPVFESDEDRTYYLVRFPVNPKAVVEVEDSTPQVTPQVAPQVTPKVTHQVIPQVKEEVRGATQSTDPVGPMYVPGSPEVTPEVRRMLALIKGNMTRLEIQKGLGLIDEKHFREYYQQPGVQQGLIEMTIPGKPRSSKQKYRLTDKGKRVLEKQ